MRLNCDFNMEDDVMSNPVTQRPCTELELLKIISEDVGRLSAIEYTLKEEGETLTVYNRISGIELRSYETVNLLHNIKNIGIGLICILSLMLLTLLMIVMNRA